MKSKAAEEAIKTGKDKRGFQKGLIRFFSILLLFVLVCGATLKTGQTVTYLTTAVNQHGQVWDYVETTVGGQTVRGYIRSGAVLIPEEPVPDVGPGAL